MTTATARKPNPFDSAAQDIERAKADPLFARLTVREYRVLCTRPHRQLSQDLGKTRGGLFKPQKAQRFSEEYALVCTVLKVGARCHPSIVEGVRVVAPQFGGQIIYDVTYGMESELWMLGDSEIMAVIDDSVHVR